MDGSRQEESDEDRRDWGSYATGCIALAVAVGGWVATGATSGALRIVCGLVTLVTGGYVVYLLGMLLIMVVVVRFFGRAAVDEPRIPWFVWVMTPLLVVSWALWSWLAGYDAEQWLWSGISVAVTAAVLVLAFMGWRPPGSRARR